MRFCTVINCMDGRVQLPVIRYLQERFNVEYVDSITEAGPNLILANGKNPAKAKAILERLEISIKKHNSISIAVVGHHDCTGNPAAEDEQIIHIQKAMEFLRKHYESIEITGLWVDEKWQVQEIDKKTD